MTGEDQGRFGWPRWFDVLLKGYVTLMAAACLFLSAENVILHSGLLPEGGRAGVVVDRAAGHSSGWWTVREVEVASPAHTEGVLPGDRFRYDRKPDGLRHMLVGDRLGFSTSRDGVVSHHEVTVKRVTYDNLTAGFYATAITNDVSRMTITLLAAVLLWRRWRGKAATCLGLFLLANGTPPLQAPLWIRGDLSSAAWQAFLSSSWLLMGLFPAFCYYMFPEGRGRLRRSLAWAWAAMTAVVGAYSAITGLAGDWNPDIVNQVSPVHVAMLAGFGLSFWVLAAGRMQASPQQRNQIRLVLLVTTLFALAWLAYVLFPLIVWSDESGLATRATRSVLLLLSAVLLLYVVLRHRLFDVGFALNRTLVYGVVSFVLLAAFGLAEWAVEHLVPESWHESGPIYSAGIALTLFLTFHRLRDFVEHGVERLFFRRWQENEARLRRFISAAAHYERTDALCRDFVDELVRFGGGEAALYLRTGGAGFERAAGLLALATSSLAADDPAFALMRAERIPIEPAEAGSALPADLLLPMFDSGSLLGFVMLGRKGDGAHWRPDEIDQLGKAALSVGLDLQALRSHELAGEVLELRAKNASLTSLIAGAMALREPAAQ